jgi:hypothetical protein
MSFAMAWIEQVVPHIEVKTAIDHEKSPLLGAPRADKQPRGGVE